MNSNILLILLAIFSLWVPLMFLAIFLKEKLPNEEIDLYNGGSCDD